MNIRGSTKPNQTSRKKISKQEESMAKGQEQEFILPVTEEEYETAGSKFVTFPPGAKVGDSVFLDCEVGMPDWDTPGKSLKFPITITEEGADKGKEDKISTGVDSKSVWKLKEIARNVTGNDLAMKKGADGKVHPALNPANYAGKPAVAHYQLITGKKGGVGEEVQYPKLMEILPTGSKPKIEGLM